MKIKQTLFFAVFVSLIVGYTIYDYSKIKYEDKNSIELVKLFPNKKLDKLKEFKIIDGNRVVFVKKVKSIWQILSPISYPADQGLMLDIINLLNGSLEELNELDDSGIFNKDSVSIGFKFKGGDYKDILVSRKKTVDGRGYIQDIKTKKYYVSTSDWFMVSKKSIFEFRWKYLFVLRENIRKINLTKNHTKKYSLEYKKEKNIWQSPFNKKLKFTDKKIAQFLSELMQIKVYRFTSEVKDDESLNEYGLLNPNIKIEFQFQDKTIKNWGLNIGKEVKGLYYATFINRDQIFELEKESVNKLKTYLNKLN